MPEANERARDAESISQTRATVEKKALKPPGLLPKNTQQLVILGVAVVMVLIMWLTGNGNEPLRQRPVRPRHECRHRTRRQCKTLNNPFKRTKPRLGNQSRRLTWDGSKQWAWPTGFLQGLCYHRTAHLLPPRWRQAQRRKINHRHHPIP